MNNKIQLNAIDIELTDELKTYINKKLVSVEKLIDFKDPSVTGDIRLIRELGGQKKGKIFKVEMSFMTAGKKFGVNADGNSLYEAIDQAKDSVVRKISDYKDKKQSLIKRGGAQVKAFLKKFSR